MQVSRTLGVSKSKPPIAVTSQLENILGCLEEHMADDVVTIDLSGKSTIADYMVICSGRSHRQVSALADHLIKTLKDKGQPVSVEGHAQGDWVLVDAADVVIHIFRPEVRSFYNLEKMWSADLSVDQSVN